MSDVEEETSPVAEVGSDDENADTSDIGKAVEHVIKRATTHDGVIRGLHQVAKALDAGKVHVCFLAESCSEPAYKKLVEALCTQHSVPCVHVPDSKLLGRWSGLCKIDKDGQARHVVGASCVAITDYGEESAWLDTLHKHISEMA